MLLNRVMKLCRSEFKNLFIRKYSSTTGSVNYDPENARIILERALDEEVCILVDEQDKVIGTASKRDCHKVYNGSEVKLHRAFSVYLFNSKGDMLIQRRSNEKVIYYIFLLNFLSSFYNI